MSEIPACPNTKCEFHCLEAAQSSSHLRLDGCYQRATHPYTVQRYRCNRCGSRFSDSTQSLESWTRRRGLTHPIFRFFCEGLANRQIGRLLNVDERTVRNRLKRLSQHALLEHAHRTRLLKIAEPIAYDGIENFAKSQYEPNNINQAIGFDSQFIYDFNFAPLNRKGHMSERQRKRKAEIEANEGCFPTSAIRTSSAKIFKRLFEKCDPQQGLKLLTDKHFQYREAIKIDLCNLKIEHQTISSKATRLYKHILFPVNHFDLLLRHHNKAFARETISFSKKHGTMILRYALAMVWRNYFRPQFTKRHKLNPESNRRSPAMAVGISNKLEKFHEFFGRLRLLSQVTINEEWQTFHQGEHTFGRCLTN